MPRTRSGCSAATSFRHSHSGSPAVWNTPSRGVTTPKCNAGSPIMIVRTDEAHGGVDSPAAWFRLVVAMTISTIGGVGMWSIMVALPTIQADFGVSRADASLPFTMVMFGFAGGGVLMGRLADRFGIAVPLALGTLAVSAGYLATGWSFKPVAGCERAPADRHRLFCKLRPADGRHIALVCAPARHCGVARRGWQLCRRHVVAACAAAFHRHVRLARDAYRASACSAW